MNTPNLWKGLVAGAIAGLIATAAKSVAEILYPPRPHGDPRSPAVLTGNFADRPFDRPFGQTSAQASSDQASSDQASRFIASETIHWGFGVTAGAFYGALAEFYPAATSKEGATFGLALMALTNNDTALPPPDQHADPEDQRPREHSSETTSHVVYGVVAEKVRSFVRDTID